MAMARKVKIGLITVGALTASLFSGLSQATSSSFNDTQVKDIQKIVREYLISNPDVLVEAAKSIREQEMKKAQVKANAAITKNYNQLFKVATDPSYGNQKGNIVVLEFMDYQCGHCKTMNGVIKSVIDGNANVKVIIKELPVFGKISESAAFASLASMKQGADKFAKLHSAILQDEGKLDEKKVMDLAQKAGLDVKKLKADMSDKAIKDAVKENFRLAQELGLLGTPAFIVTNLGNSKFKFIPGTTTAEDLNAAITEVKS